MNMSPEELSILCSCTVRYAVGIPRNGTVPAIMYADIVKLRARDMTRVGRESIAADIRAYTLRMDQQEEAEWLRLAEFLEAMG